MGEWGINRTVGILFIIIVLIALIFSGTELYAATKETAVNVFPGGKDLLTKLIPEKPPSREMEKTQADEIYSVIKKTLDKMEKDKDCIEEIDFSEINKEFILEFNQFNGGTELLIYKISNDQMERIFDYGINIKRFGNIEELSKNLDRLLYKNKGGTVFLVNSKDKDYSYLKYKQVCDTGEYLIEITLKDLETEYNEVVIEYNEVHTSVPKEKERLKKIYPGIFKKREKDGLWVRIKDGEEEVARSSIEMLNHIKDTIRFKYKVSLYNIIKDKDTTPRG